MNMQTSNKSLSFAVWYSILSPVVALAIWLISIRSGTSTPVAVIAFSLLAGLLVVSGFAVGLALIITRRQRDQTRGLFWVIVGTLVNGAIILLTIVRTPDVLKQSEQKKRIATEQIAPGRP